MKRNALITIVGTLLLVSGWALPGLCGEIADASPSLVYGAYVDDYIQKCEAKMDMLDSSSLNIRKDAMRSTIKGAFVKSNRSSLIQYLVGKNVPFNAHRIQYHLNQQYTQTVHPQKVYAVLLKDQLEHGDVNIIN